KEHQVGFIEGARSGNPTGFDVDKGHGNVVATDGVAGVAGQDVVVTRVDVLVEFEDVVLLGDPFVDRVHFRGSHLGSHVRLQNAVIVPRPPTVEVVAVDVTATATGVGD